MAAAVPGHRSGTTRYEVSFWDAARVRHCSKVNSVPPATSVSFVLALEINSNGRTGVLMATRDSVRRADLRQMLIDRRRETRHDARDRVQNAGAHGPQPPGGAGRQVGMDLRGDVEWALSQMSTADLDRIDAALARLDAGAYGRCLACALEITEERLLALPFAVRCAVCEARRVRDETRLRWSAHRGSGSSLFSDTASF